MAEYLKKELEEQKSLNEETNQRHDTEINDFKLRLTSKEVELEKQIQQQYDELEDLDKTMDEESKYALDELNAAASGNMFDGTQEAEYDEIDNAHQNDIFERFFNV